MFDSQAEVTSLVTSTGLRQPGSDMLLREYCLMRHCFCGSRYGSDGCKCANRDCPRKHLGGRTGDWSIALTKLQEMEQRGTLRARFPYISMTELEHHVQRYKSDCSWISDRKRRGTSITPVGTQQRNVDLRSQLLKRSQLYSQQGNSLSGT